MSRPSENKTPRTLFRSNHPISRLHFSKNALHVLSRLNEAGHTACLVGGCVRDLLIGHHPKDFDVATDAHPEVVHALFKKSRLVGRRFRIVHVGYGREIVEVSTFRGNGKEPHHDREVRDGMLVRDNVYGTLEEDVWRRDFTVNALYYDIHDRSVVDYVDGLKDLKAGVLRLIGQPEVRYQEDPVRMLRAVRFSAKLDFSIHGETAEPIPRLGSLLLEVAPARLFEETLKLFMSGYAEKVFYQLEKYRLLEYLLPFSRLEHSESARRFFLNALKNTDTRIAQRKPVTPAFLVATSLWAAVQRAMQEALEQGESEAMAYRESAYSVLAQQASVVRQPKRFSAIAREIWMLQPRFHRRRGKRALNFIAHPRFRAAYDFLLLRHQSGEAGLEELCAWWTKIQQVSSEEKKKMIGLVGGPTYHRQRKK